MENRIEKFIKVFTSMLYSDHRGTMIDSINLYFNNDLNGMWKHQLKKLRLIPAMDNVSDDYASSILHRLNKVSSRKYII